MPYAPTKMEATGIQYNMDYETAYKSSVGFSFSLFLRLVSILALTFQTNNNNKCKFEVLTAVVMKNYIFWETTPWSPLKVNRRFVLATCLHACLLLGLSFDPEDGGDIFLQNVGGFSTDYTALYPRRQNSS
jgi:hypothetical protein